MRDFFRGARTCTSFRVANFYSDVINVIYDTMFYALSTLSRMTITTTTSTKPAFTASPAAPTFIPRPPSGTWRGATTRSDSITRCPAHELFS